MNFKELNFKGLQKEVENNFFVKVHDAQVKRRQEQKRDADILKSAKAIYKFSDNADTVRNEANHIIKVLEGE